MNAMHNRLVEIFCTLVRIDSISGEEKTIADYLVKELRVRKLFAKKDRHGNVFARLPGKGTPYVFCAHMDTVEPGRGIKPQVKNGYIRSDGTTILGADNKIAIACFFEMIDQIREKNIATNPIEFMFTCSEETGNYGAIKFDYSLLRARIGFSFDFTQPVGAIVTASPFYERFNLILIGKEAHASRPHEGINVLPALRDILTQSTLGKLDNVSIFNIGVVNGGYVRNTIPGEIMIKGELRSFKESHLNNHKQNFINLVKKTSRRHKLTHNIEFVRENPGYYHTGHKQKLVLHFIKEKMSECNIQSSTLNAWGVSDVNIFNGKSLTCFNLGNGGEYAHSKRERVKISQMQKLVKLMIKLSSN